MKTILSNRWKDIVFICIAFIVLMLIVEIVVRFYLFGMDSFDYEKMMGLSQIGNTSYLQQSKYPEIVFELKPNLNVSYKFANLKTNSQGLRDEEYTIKKPVDTFRAVVLGGSFTFPSGVELKDAFHTLLEERLNNEYSERKHEFINFAVPGYRINNKLATLKYKALRYDPDIILFMLDSSRFTGDKKIRKYIPHEKNGFFRSYTYTLLKTNKLFQNDKLYQKAINEHLASVDDFDRALQELSKISKDSNIPVCIVVLDHEYSHYEAMSKVIEKLVRKNNLCYSNTIPSFRNKNFNDMTILRTDFHPNEEAQQIFADVIYNDLKRQSFLEY